MPGLDSPRDPTSLARSPAALGHAREGAKERAPPEAHRRSRLGGWGGCVLGRVVADWRLPPSLSSRTLLSHDYQGCLPPRRSQASPSPIPESREVSLWSGAGGLLRASCGKPLAAGPLQGCWFRGTIVSPLGTDSLQKSSAVLLLASSPPQAPGAGNCGAQATPPGANPDSLLIRARCSVGRSPLKTPSPRWRWQ